MCSVINLALISLFPSLLIKGTLNDYGLTVYRKNSVVYIERKELQIFLERDIKEHNKMSSKKQRCKTLSDVKGIKVEERERHLASSSPKQVVLTSFFAPPGANSLKMQPRTITNGLSMEKIIFLSFNAQKLPRANFFALFFGKICDSDHIFVSTWS